MTSRKSSHGKKEGQNFVAMLFVDKQRIGRHLVDELSVGHRIESLVVTEKD